MEELTKLISEYSEQECSYDDFGVYFGCDKEGNITVEVNWPKAEDLDITKEHVAGIMALLLSYVNDGKLSPNVAQAVENYGKDNEESDIAQLVIKVWAQKSESLPQEKSDALCVDPTEVFVIKENK